MHDPAFKTILAYRLMMRYQEIINCTKWKLFIVIKRYELEIESEQASKYFIYLGYSNNINIYCYSKARIQLSLFLRQASFSS